MKKIKIRIKTFINDEEAKYIIYYARNGIIPPNMNLCTALEWVDKNITNENIHIKSIKYNDLHYSYYFSAEVDFSMDIWTNNEINYDFVIFAKQTEHEQYINACTTKIKKKIRYSISSSKNLEKIIQPFEEIIFIFDEEDYYYNKYNYYITFDQEISLDLIDINCSSSREEENPEININDCNIFQEPGSSNSYILRINSQYSYVTIIMKKKKHFEKELKMIITKRLIDNFYTEIISKQKEDDFPLIFKLSLKNRLFRKITKNFEIYYTEDKIENINDKTIFKKDNLLMDIINDIVVIIPLKNLKLEILFHLKF